MENYLQLLREHIESMPTNGYPEGPYIVVMHTDTWTAFFNGETTIETSFGYVEIVLRDEMRGGFVLIQTVERYDAHSFEGIFWQP